MGARILGAPARTQETGDVLGAVDLERVLRRECARSDRTGRPFCLATFHLRYRDPHAAFRLADLLAQRIRATDSIGWLPDARIAVILPDTQADAARCFASAVGKLAREASLLIDWQIQAYPPIGSDNGNGDRPDVGPRDGPPNNRPANGTPNGLHVGLDHGDCSSRQLLEALLQEHSVPPVESAEIGRALIRPLPAWKRAIDLIGSAIGLVVLSPLLLAIAMMIRFSSAGPIIFKQQRSGLGGTPFWMYKFRTMISGAEGLKGQLRTHSEQDGPAFKIRIDPRVTRLGRFLRATSLDELPQLWNVLKGDMSLVGPRPLPLEESSACEPWQLRRLDVTPGITCIWQVKGRCHVSFSEWMRMDISYSRRRTLLRDLKILLVTLPAVVFRRGAY